MNDEQLIDRLNSIAERFYVLPARTILGSVSPPFDISRPVIHDNKSEFLLEKKAVDDLLQATATIHEIIGDQASDDKPLQRKTSVRLMNVMDQIAIREKSRAIPSEIDEFLLNSAIDQKLSLSLFRMLLTFRTQLVARQQALEDQEDEYWSSAHRPPNHYARIIALRFAMAIYHGTGALPTFGLARDGNHPSTEYGRALEEIFNLLGIQANIKNAAVWALKQAIEQVELEPRNNLLGRQRKFDSRVSNSTIDLLAKMVSSQGKGPFQ